jgi:acyl-CoA thioesterase
MDEGRAPDAVAAWLGIEVDEVGAGRARVHMTAREDLLNRHGVVHGGVVFALADAAFDLACNSHGPTTLARAADITFVAAVRAGERLEAEAVEVVRAGRSGVYDVTVRRGVEVVAVFRGQSQSLRG